MKSALPTQTCEALESAGAVMYRYGQLEAAEALQNGDLHITGLYAQTPIGHVLSSFLALMVMSGAAFTFRQRLPCSKEQMRAMTLINWGKLITDKNRQTLTRSRCACTACLFDRLCRQQIASTPHVSRKRGKFTVILPGRCYRAYIEQYPSALPLLLHPA